MPKQINVKLGFEADTSQAKKQIQDLQKSLDNLMTSSMKNTSMQDFSKGMIEAQQSAVKLKSILGESMNIDTGRLDLVKFNQQLQDSGLTLSKLGSQLSSLGPEGKQAFLNLADSIVTAQKPMIETNKLLDGMWTALKNTARWQLSSSILHGFMSSLQGAYGYAQDLNASLNSIRIVSGQSVEQMAAFADQANRSAQALSTSTLAYTDAALIFYQQGLTGDAVTERVDTVLKLSNVTGDSADQVSNYMTAIWNNFYDGSQSLESFADKITALGAATASSSAEISAGLQQFASIANTVGLSYDYAATALATIVAKTRQSESTVGNGLRTIFARLSSLKEGGLTDDGVDLTKYTKALQDIGVQLFDQNGQYREMDEILNDIGTKWQTLSKNQQIALAQTVGGVRQYATLMALFDDWDQFQRNLDVTQNAEGTLQEQQDIYAESWEAAQKRVKAAWQSIYQDLIDDKFFIDILNKIADIIKGVDKLIDSIGGLKGVLAAIGVIATQVFSKQLETGIKNAATNLNKIFYGDKIADYNAEQATKAAKEQLSDKYEDQAQNAIIENKIYQIELNNELRKSRKALTQDELEYYEAIVKSTGAMAEQYSLAIENQQKASSKNLQARKSALNTLYDNYSNDDEVASWENILSQNTDSSEYKEFLNEIRDSSNIEDVIKKYTSLGKSVKLTSEQIRELVETEKELDEARKMSADLGVKQRVVEEGIRQAREQGIPVSEAISNQLQLEKTKIEENITALDEKLWLEKNSAEEEEDLKQELADLGREYDAVTEQIKNYNQEKAKSKYDMPEDASKSPGFNFNTEKIVKGAQAISQLTMAFTSFSNILKIAEDDSLSAGEKIKQALTSFNMGLIAVIGGMKSLALALPGVTAQMVAQDGVVKALTIGFKNLLAAMMPIIANPLTWVFIGLAVAIGAVIWKLGEAERAADKAAKKVKELKEEYEKLHSEFEELESTLSNLNDSQKALDDLKVGTEEWRKAVHDLNEEIMEVISKYPELAQYVQNINGSLRLSQEGMKQYLDKQYTEQQEQYAELIQGQKEQKEADFNKAAQNLSNKTINIPNASGNVDDANNTANINYGAALNVEDIKTVAKAYIENNALLGGSLEQVAENLQKVGITSQDTIQQIYNNRDAIRDLALEYQSTGTSIEAMTDAFYQANIENKVGDKIRSDLENQDKDYLASAVENSLSEHAQELAAQYEEQGIAAGEAFNRGVTEAVSQYENDPNNFINQAEYEAKGKVAAALGTNSGTQINENEFDNFWNSLSSEDKQYLIEVGIDEESSYKEIRETLDKMEVERDNSYKIDFQIDEDVDEDELNGFMDYIHDHASDLEGFSSHLEQCKEEAAELAHAILRFDAAIQDVTDNYEEWMDMLNSGSVQDAAKAARELSNAYGDLLDIDGSVLSADFASNTKHLEDMKAAIEGDAEAYERLQEAAGEDILIQAGIDTSKFDQDKQWIIDNVNDLFGRDWGQIEIGADLNDQQFLDKLTEMIKFCGDSVEQAEAYLQNLGVNAKVVKDTSTDVDEQETGDFTAELIPTSQTADIPFMQGMTGGFGIAHPQYTVYGVNYTPQKGKITTTKETTATALKVESAHKSAGGQIKYQHSNHGGGANGAGNNRGSGKKGGGGGGSKPKKKTVKDYAKKNFEEDRYHNIKSAINEVTKALTRLDKLKDRAYGKAKLKYMDQEIDKLKDQVRLTDMYIKEAKQYLALDRSKLEGTGMGAIFTDEGRLLNYEQVLQNMLASYNSAVDAYNGSVDQFNAGAQEDSDNQMLENAKKQLDKAKEVYDKNKEILKQYESTYDTLQEQLDKRIELLNQIYDAKLAKVVWKVDIQLEVNDADLEFLQWMNKYIQKDFRKAADAIANLSKQMGDYSKNINAVKNGLRELFENHNIVLDYNNLNADDLVRQLREFQDIQGLGSELTENEAAQIREWMTYLMKAADDMLAAFEEAHELVNKTFEEWNDKIDRQIDKYDQLRDAIEAYKDIADLTGQRIINLTNEDIQSLDRSIINNSVNTLESLREVKEENEKLLQDLLAIDTSGFNEDALREWEKTRELYEDQVAESNSKFINQWKQTLEDAKDAYSDAMDFMAKEYDKTLGELNFLTDRFDRQREVDHLYLDDYEKYHELNKDIDQLRKSIDKTNNDILKSKLIDFEDELNDAMSTGVKISERQAEVYARRVALLQAEAELMDAQNAKSAVRMTRDNEGNFSYTYTADQEAIDGAEENYGDTFYDYLKYLRDSQEELQSEQLQKEQEWLEKRKEIQEMYLNGEIEDLDAALAELDAQYEEYRLYFLDQQTFFLDEQKRLRNEDWAFAQELMGVQLAEENDFITEFGNTLIGRLHPQYLDAESWAKDWARAMAEADTAAIIALRTWEQDVKTILKAAGTSADTFKDQMVGDLKNIEQESKTNKDDVHAMAVQMDSDMNAVMRKALEMDARWSQDMANMRYAIIDTVRTMNDMLAKLADISGYQGIVSSQTQVMGGAFATAGDQAETAASQYEELAEALNDVADAMRNLQNAGNGNSNSSNNGSAKDLIKQGVNEVRDLVSTPRGITDNSSSRPSGGIKNTSSSSLFSRSSGGSHFATGGYTGAWGSEGKLAVLHEKELVLNKEDTDNILSVVDTVRGLANKFDLSSGLDQFAKIITGSGSLALAGAGSLDQNVHIEANFPNVQSHSEIELALNNLINSASQYVNRK